MAGGATEKVNDWYSANYYLQFPTKNPAGPKTGDKKVARGTNMIETPWLSANTVIRRGQPLQWETHFLRIAFGVQFSEASSTDPWSPSDMTNPRQ